MYRRDSFDLLKAKVLLREHFAVISTNIEKNHLSVYGVFLRKNVGNVIINTAKHFSFCVKRKTSQCQSANKSLGGTYIMYNHYTNKLLNIEDDVGVKSPSIVP